MSFIKNKQLRLHDATMPSLGDIVEIDEDLYIITGLNPLELTDIDHYGREETKDN